MKYRIEFERIGRSQKALAPIVLDVVGEADLCSKVRNLARPHIRSRDFDVMIDHDKRSGWLAAGMHCAGKFKVEPV